MHILSISDPIYYHQAIKFLKQRLVIHDEMKTLETNSTWSIVHLLKGKQPINYKYVYKTNYYKQVYKTKYNSNGSHESYKVWLVTKSYMQCNEKVLISLKPSHLQPSQQLLSLSLPLLLHKISIYFSSKSTMHSSIEIQRKKYI